MKAFRCFLVALILALDVPITIILFGFYSPSWLFHSHLIVELLAPQNYLSSPVDFLVLASIRSVLLLALCLYVCRASEVKDIRMWSFAFTTANYSYSLMRLLCFAEWPEMLYFPGVWLTVAWSIMSACFHCGLCCYLIASSSRLIEYHRLEETEAVPGSDCGRRESTWRIVCFLFGYYRAQWLWYCLGFIFLTLYALSRVFIPAFIGQVLANIVLGRGVSALLRSILIMGLLVLNSTIFGGLRGGVFTYAGALVLKQIRLDLFGSLIQQDIAFFDTTKSGEVVSRVSSDCQTMGASLSLNVNILMRNMVMLVGSLCVMFYMSWKMTLITFILIPATTFITKWYGAYYDRLSEKTQTTIAEANNKAEEVLSSMRTVRSFACEALEVQAFANSLDGTLKINKKKSIAYMGYTLNNEMNQNGILIAVLIYGGHLVVSGFLTADVLIAFLLYQIQLGENIYWIASAVTGLMEGVGASRKVFNYIHRRPAMAFNGSAKPVLRGTIRFNDVYFTYPTRPNNHVFKGLNLTIKAGQTTALVGPSGSGKSSIVSLIEHMYEPISGSITIDDVPIQDIDHEYYHERIALVAQEPVLYNTTIKDNILYGCEWATEVDMLQAAKTANVHDFVMELEKKYDTSCGDRGIQLSGGQKQRIAIARALVRNPCVLILDEATSALDAESEAQVQEAISRCAEKHTVLIIAHRLSTVEKADTIAVIQNGTVVQTGTHKSLMEDSEGVYCSLVSKQLLSALS